MRSRFVLLGIGVVAALCQSPQVRPPQTRSPTPSSRRTMIGGSVPGRFTRDLIIVDHDRNARRHLSLKDSSPREDYDLHVHRTTQGRCGEPHHSTTFSD